LSARAALIEAFLARHGWAGVPRRPIVGDASFRRYERLANGPARSVVLMDAPPPQENVRPFVALAGHLAALGLSAPRVFAEDAENGLLLLEDFGDASMARLVDGTGDRRALYALAIDTLIALHRHPDARKAPAPPYGEERLLREVGLVLDWYLPAITGKPATPAQRDSYLAAWRAVLSRARGVPDTLVLFDFFPDNLMLLDGRPGIAACGLLDFQDAVVGPLTYDLVSILEDARRDVPAGLQAESIERYLAAFPALDRAAFAASYAVMGAQRNARILGVFTRLCVRDGKPGYLRHIPRVWRHIARSVGHPALAPVKAWLDAEIPPPLRRIPPCGPKPPDGGPPCEAAR
jgi:aminoglycoside/choline kinase family phosphotransferase